jgi:hypothetical protein
MERMKELQAFCRAGIYLSINEHKDYYETIEDHFNNNPFIKDDLTQEELDRIVKADCLVELQFYPSTPITFYRVYGTSIDEVLDKAIKLIRS